MKISSYTTYLLPFLLLLVTNFWTVSYWSSEYIDNYRSTLDFQIGLSIVVTAALYIVFRISIKIVKAKYLKMILWVLPFIIQNMLAAKHDTHYSIQIAFPVIFGSLLFLSFILFDERYTATLSETSIQYCSLLGQSGDIPLQSITKVEQKRNMLSFFFKEFKLLDLAKKTCIAFCDENMDEYEINFFAPLFKGKRVFEKIISDATELGNHKIRQYQL
jgi:hypothetical protein